MPAGGPKKKHPKPAVVADGVHVSPDEREDALDPAVGAGTPDTAPSFEPIDGPGVELVPRQIGWSPKVLNSTAVLAGVGAALLIYGLVADDESIRNYGLTLLAASGVVLPVGFKSSPGEVGYVPKADA